MSMEANISDEAQCVHCGAGTLTIEEIARSFGCGDKLFIVENVPMWACTTCGESWFTAQTMHEIEGVKARRSALQSNITFSHEPGGPRKRQENLPAKVFIQFSERNRDA